MADLDYDEMYKIVLVGDPGVGKTNLLAYFQADLGAQRPGADGAAATFKKARKPTVGEFQRRGYSFQNVYMLAACKKLLISGCR
jgi:dephospho-CoA kinase